FYSTHRCLSRSRLVRDLHSFPPRRSSDLPVPRISGWVSRAIRSRRSRFVEDARGLSDASRFARGLRPDGDREIAGEEDVSLDPQDRKSTRLNSSHVKISYAVFCLKKKTYR